MNLNLVRLINFFLFIVLFGGCNRKVLNSSSTNLYSKDKGVGSITKNAEKYYLKGFKKKAYIKILELKDAEIFFKVVQENEKHLKQYMEGITNMYGISIKKTKLNLEARSLDGKYEFGIWHNGNLVGCVGFHSINAYNKNSAEIKYWIDERSQGKGLSYAACNRLLQFGFESLGLKVVNSMPFNSNKPSINLSKGLGFQLQEEGDIPYQEMYRRWPYKLRKDPKIETKKGKIPMLYKLTKKRWLKLNGFKK